MLNELSGKVISLSFQQDHQRESLATASPIYFISTLAGFDFVKLIAFRNIVKTRIFILITGVS